MASKARARAELNLKNFPYNGSEAEKQQAREQAFKVMLTVFRRRCNDYGIMHAYHEHEFFESKPSKDRRKRKEAELRRLKEEDYEKNGPRKKSKKDDRQRNRLK
jgi:ribosomal protein S21